MDDSSIPSAFFLTFTCYGTWLHGRDPGSVDAEHNAFGDPFLPPNPGRETLGRTRMAEFPFSLDASRRKIVLATLQEVSEHRGWRLFAAHVRTKHVHLIVRGNADPDKMLDDFKAYCTRRLKEAKFDLQRKRRWIEGGSTRYLWKADEIPGKIDYVVHQQGRGWIAMSRIRWSSPSGMLSGPR